mgnify:CR=1 FL=1
MAEILQKVSRFEKSICGKCSHRFVCRALDNQPCFECNQFAEEVVRCGKCLYYSEATGKDSGKPIGYGSCTKLFHITNIVTNEDFCSFGRRRADAKMDGDGDG